jgi:addiction module HigA family antidote
MHPGEVLREEFLSPHGLSAYRLAEGLMVPRTRIERIVREEVGITPDTALRLAEFFGTTPEFWMRLQERFDIETKQRAIAAQLKQIKKRAPVSCGLES